MLRWLLGKRRVHRPYYPPADTSGYRVYTAEFDDVVGASDIAPDLSGRGFRGMARQEFDDVTESVSRAQEALRETLAALANEPEIDPISDPTTPPAVVLLIDHSGSLRARNSKQGAIWAYVLANLFVQLAQRHGVPFEILGFTTVDWRGGEPRRRWLRDGKPADPGRLCPLRHIVYSAFDTVTEPDMRTVLRPDVLKENVDGEAVLWAQQRLLAFSPSGGDLIVVSDGAPVDDSTLKSNSENYLMDHLKAVVATTLAQDRIRLHGVGLDYDVSAIYPNSCRITSQARLASIGWPFFQGILMGNQA
ncbi:MAG: hypothetical protein AAGD13_10160 [Pseudomonadota bacterium]